jgi:hypothetical protein
VEQLGEDDVEALLLHNGIGVTAKFTGEVDLAAEHYGRALEILEARGGDDRCSAACTTTWAAWPTPGATWRPRSCTRARRWPCTRAGRVGASSDRGSSGSILSELGRHDEAIAMLRQAAEEFAALLGPDHVEVAIAQTTLGAALHRAGRLDEAAEAYATGLAARERALGADHPELAPTLLNLGQLAADNGDAATATSYATRAVAVLDGNVVAEHPFLRLARQRAGI